MTFTADQWAALEAAFPTGGCDYTIPGITQVPFLGPCKDYS